MTTTNELSPSGTFRTIGKLLEAQCNDCGRYAKLQPFVLPFHDMQPVSFAGRYLKCSWCVEERHHPTPGLRRADIRTPIRVHAKQREELARKN